MKEKRAKVDFSTWIGGNRWTILVLIVAAVVFVLLRLWAAPAAEEEQTATEYAVYEKGTVTAVLSDDTFSDPTADGGYRGEQLLQVEVTSGDYVGETLLVPNYVGPLYGEPVAVGDSVVLTISVYEDGSHTATVYEYHRFPVLLGCIIAFLVVAVLVGGKTGLKSLASLAVTLGCLFFILLPLLLKGMPTLPTVLLICVYIAVVGLTILGGIRKKSLCAMAGTIAGTCLAIVFSVLAQHLAHISGLRLDDVEPLLQLRQTGVPIGLKDLLTGGIIISALGAVMDVTMGVSSAIAEVHATDPALTARDLFRSGMNVGRDMVGTMTNTLILAFLGSGFTLILYLFTLSLSPLQLLNSAYFATEVISGLSCSIGVILSIPVTAGVCALAFGRKENVVKEAP